MPVNKDLAAVQAQRGIGYPTANCEVMTKGESGVRAWFSIDKYLCLPD